MSTSTKKHKPVKMVIIRDKEHDHLMTSADQIGVFLEEGSVVEKVFMATTHNEACQISYDHHKFGKYKPMSGPDTYLDTGEDVIPKRKKRKG